MKANSLAKPLAKPGDPLVLGNGSIISPDELIGEGVDDQHPEPVKLNPKTYKPSTRRSIKELPADPKTLNALSVIFMYTVAGLTDREILDATGLSKAELSTARSHPAYAHIFELIFDEFINANATVLTSRIAAASNAAFNTVANLAVKGKKEETRLSASKDVLDRAGVRPKDNEARNSVNKNELRIVVTTDDKHVGLELNGVRLAD